MKIIKSFKKFINEKSNIVKIDYFILTILSVAFFIFKIGDESLWLDEIYTYYASNTFQNLIDTLAWKERNMLLYHTAMYFWKFLGPGETIMRLLSALFAYIGVVMIYKLGKELTNRYVGLVAGILLVVNNFYIEYAQEARSYSLFATLFIASTFYLLKYLRENNRRNRNLYTLFTVLSIYSHIYSFLFIGLQFLTLLYSSKLSVKKLTELAKIYGTVIIATLILFVPYIIKYFGSSISKATGGLLWVKEPVLSTLLYQYGLFASNSLTLLVLYTLLIIFFTLLFIRSKSSINSRDTVFVIYLYAVSFVPILFVFVFSITIMPIFVTRYFIFVLPALILIVALAINLIKARAIALALVLCLLLLNINVLRFYYFDRQKEPWREVVSKMQNIVARDEVIVLFPYFLSLPYYYYDVPRSQKTIVAFPEGLKDFSQSKMAEQLNDLYKATADYKGIWLVTRKEVAPSNATIQKKEIEKMYEKQYKTKKVVSKYGSLELIHYSNPR